MPCRGGDAQVVTMLALYSNVRSSNPAENVVEKNKNKQKEAIFDMWHILIICAALDGIY